jgi:hypothetical protein
MPLPPGKPLTIAVRFKILDLPLGLVARHAVFLLHRPYQLITLSFDAIEIVFGEFSPLLLDLAFYFFPFALNRVPVHLRASSSHGQKLFNKLLKIEHAVQTMG